jgi:diadenosine tetraphosphate (Ap4A) HIT family hydrolase
MTDLDPGSRRHLMHVVVAVEAALRSLLAPDKINLAALGNMVPHLHWHVIARFDWDSHFPQPIWGNRQRSPEPPATQRLGASLSMIDESLRQALAGGLTGFGTIAGSRRSPPRP